MEFNFNFEHLDKNHADGAHEAFLKVQEARAILTNPIKRDLYNLSRREASIDEPDPEPNIPDNDDVPKNRHRNKRKKRRQRADEVRMVNIGKKDILFSIYNVSIGRLVSNGSLAEYYYFRY